MTSPHGKRQSASPLFGSQDYDNVPPPHIRHGDWEETQITTFSNLALANLLAKNKSSLLDKRMFQLYYCLFVATLCSCINGCMCFHGDLLAPDKN
jgi:hypothetical protein